MTHTTAPSSETIVRTYLEAVGHKDYARVEALLHPDVQFVGPAMKLSGPREVITSLRRIGAIHVRNDVQRVFVAGDEVCVIYDFVTDTAGALPTIEWVRLDGGRIRATNLYYDQVPWLTIREELARRATQATA